MDCPNKTVKIKNDINTTKTIIEKKTKNEDIENWEAGKWLTAC